MDRRSIVVRARVTMEEYEYLCSKAEQSSETKCRSGAKNLSGYIRKCILEESGYLADRNHQREQRELKNLTYQIRKIGVNINQATKKINSGYYGRDTCAALQEGLDKVEQRLSELIRLLEECENGSDKADEH